MTDSRKRIVLEYLLGHLKGSKLAYGYNIWISNNITARTLIWNCAVEILKVEPPPPYIPPSGGMVRVYHYGADDSREMKTAEEIWSFACDVLWLLCTRNLLRPGVYSAGGQSVSDGQGYLLTLKGQEWIQSYTEADLQQLLSDL